MFRSGGHGVALVRSTGGCMGGITDNLPCFINNNSGVGRGSAYIASSLVAKSPGRTIHSSTAAVPGSRGCLAVLLR